MEPATMWLWSSSVPTREKLWPYTHKYDKMNQKANTATNTSFYNSKKSTKFNQIWPLKLETDFSVGNNG